MADSSQEINPIVDREKAIEKFWREKDIFAKSLAATKDGPPRSTSLPRVKPRGSGQVYSFYDGPPFATGLPHYGHLVPNLMKDVMPRFWTMRGYYVERRWGWDCHGLPIENIVEKELGFKSKKDIEDYGVEKFNQACRSKVLAYTQEWKKTIARFGRWVDMEHPYQTMDLDYMESVWWVFKELFDRGLIYEGYKSMHICPRCETTLSQSEVTEGYKDIKDISVTVKFEIKESPTPSGASRLPPLGQGENSPIYILAWTTTPWTLPGNVALAVGKEIEYTQVVIPSPSASLGINSAEGSLKKERDSSTASRQGRDFGRNDNYIVAKVLLEKVFAGYEYEIIKEFKGSDLVGKKYHPLFPYYESAAAKAKIKNSQNLYTIVSADFVTTEDGTGVVHLAPAYGEEDLELGREKNLAFIQNVTLGGIFTNEVKDFAGLPVKSIEDVKATDKKIVAYLKNKNLLFSSEEYEHSYPHCWRCDTPLINYTTSSWFVKVTDVKFKALKLAKNINWFPAHIKEGRFGKWLEGARDWSISRQRFWASVIPIWKCDCGQLEVLGSINDLRKKSEQPITKITFVRHGESEKNILKVESDSSDKFPLTKIGRQQAKELAKQFKNQKFEVIISSPTLRTKETAEILAKKLGLEVTIDDLVNEYDWGRWNNLGREQWSNYQEYKQLNRAERFNYQLGQTGESRAEVVQRVKIFLDETIKKYPGKNILLISHGGINAAIHKILTDCDGDEYWAWEAIGYVSSKDFYLMANGRELDLHKDTMDKINLTCQKCGGKMKRISDVLDTWFDSGSMPYAQAHYPFANQEKFAKSFPAQFIAEGVDQTRAWFYYLHLIASAIKNSRAFSNVIANGIVLAEDGKKMSKKLQNYPEPEIIMAKYGADALRFYLLSSPVMAAENLNFSESGVKEALQKVVMLLNNILSFYKLYEIILPLPEGEKISPKAKSERVGVDTTNNILDRWLLAKLNLLIQEVTKQMAAYDLPKSVRPIQGFIDEFSTWWLRRSRDRFKSPAEKDKKEALAVFKHTLTELSKIMAPFVPFLAEYLYGHVGAEKESVHLEKWPTVDKRLINKKLLQQMEQARKIVELGLAKRAEAGIKIRQPLVSLKFPISNFQFPNNQEQFLALIKDEVNVKEVKPEKIDQVELDIEITEELKIEGALRELIHTINNQRKKQGLTIGDKINVAWQSDGAIIRKIFADENYLNELKYSTLTTRFQRQDNDGSAIEINGESIKLKIETI